MSQSPVLVIDDDRDNRAAVMELLEDEGIATIGAANGVEALKLLWAGANPCVMLVDLEMPVMDGETFCRACLADRRFSEIPRIMISGAREAPEVAARTLAIGCLTKPIDPARLMALIVGFVKPSVATALPGGSSGPRR